MRLAACPPNRASSSHPVSVGGRLRKPQSDGGQFGGPPVRPGGHNNSNSGSGGRRNNGLDAWGRNGTEARNINANNNRDASLRRGGNDVWRNSLERRNNAANSSGGGEQPLWRNGGGGGRTPAEQMTKERALHFLEEKLLTMCQ